MIFQFLAGFELATIESAVQCLIHWTTAYLTVKLVPRALASFQDGSRFSEHLSSKCLRSVSIMLATATPQSPAIKRPLENLEPYNYPHRQTENLYDTKTSRELERLRSLHV